MKVCGYVKVCGCGCVDDITVGYHGVVVTVVVVVMMELMLLLFSVVGESMITS